MPAPTAFVRLSVVAVAASGLIVSACQREEAAPPPEAPAPRATQPTLPVSPPSPIGRAELLAAVDAAASAYASGATPTSDAIAGRTFAIQQTFGCAGPAAPLAEGAPGDGLARWSWGPERKTIRITLAPGDWTGSSLIAGGDQTWETVEGFWLSRPWMRTDGCPGVAADPLVSGPGAPTPQTVGIASVFNEDSSRLGRRNGQPYSFVVRGEGDQPAATPTAGYRLALEGRFTAFADGRAIRCRAASPDQRPVCIAAAQIDRVALLGADGAVLSEWRGG